MRFFLRVYGGSMTLVFGLTTLNGSARQVDAQTAPLPAPPAAVTGQQRSEEYVIQAGDELSLKFFYHTALNEEVKVRPDGRISLQLVGEIMAAGRTPRELTEQLQASYGAKLVEPEVAVIVKTFSGYRIFVAGEVGVPGEHPLVGRTTVLQAIAQAEGLKVTARTTEVLVIRRNLDATPHVIPVNLKSILDGTDLRQDLVLAPYDVIFVPRSRVSNVNNFVEQFLTNNIPFSFGFRIDVNLQR